MITIVLFFKDLCDNIRNDGVFVESCSVIIVSNTCIGTLLPGLGQNCRPRCGSDSHVLEFRILSVVPFSTQIFRRVDLVDQQTGVRYKNSWHKQTATHKQVGKKIYLHST